MNPTQFLQYAGIILVVLAVLGFLSPNVLGVNTTFTPAENWAHLVLGLVALAVVYWSSENAPWLTKLYGIVALLVGVVGFFVVSSPQPNFLGANLDNPIDNVLHLVVGAWGLWAGFKK